MNRFQDQKYGKWFAILFPVIQSGASTQPDQATELFTCNNAANYENGGKNYEGPEGQEDRKRILVTPELIGIWM